MERKRAKCAITSLPAELWPLVASKLNLSDICALLNASNKALRYTLTTGGGIKSIEACERRWNFRTHLDWLSRTHYTSCTLRRLPTNALLPQLTSLVYIARKNHKGVEISLEDLPRSLLRLELLVPQCSTPLWRSRAGVPLKDICPMLRHFRMIWRLETQEEIPPFASSLPGSLESLGVKCKGPFRVSFSSSFVRWILDSEDRLPDSITWLGWFERPTGGSFGFNLLMLGDPKLPASLNTLILPDHTLEGKEMPEDCTIETAHFYSVRFSDRPRLPPSITRLVEECYPNHRLPQESYPETLKSLDLKEVADVKKGFPILPSLEKFTYGSVLPEKMDLVQAFNLFTLLQELHLPRQTLLEATLCLLPATLLHLTLYDVVLDGSSIPIDAKKVSDVSQMRKWFLAHHCRPFVLHLVHESALNTVADINKLHFPSRLESIILPSISRGGHDRNIIRPAHLQTLSALPASLTRIHFLPISHASFLQALPATLTSLHFIQAPSTPPPVPLRFEVETLLQHLPHLTELASIGVNLSSRQWNFTPVAPSIIVGPQYLSKGSVLMENEDDSELLVPMPHLRLPSDAIHALVEHYRNGPRRLVITGFGFHTQSLLENISKFRSPQVSLSGYLQIMDAELESISNSSSITHLDLSALKLPIHALTAFPPGLTFLSLDPVRSFYIIVYRSPLWNAILPKTLRTLELTFTEIISHASPPQEQRTNLWENIADLLPLLQQLGVTYLKERAPKKFKKEFIQLFPDAYRTPLSSDVIRIVGTKCNKNCSLM